MTSFALYGASSTRAVRHYLALDTYTRGMSLQPCEFLFD